MEKSLSKSELVNYSRLKNSITENGMATNSTSLNSCVDMFFMAGSARHWENNQIENLFQKALSEDPLMALKIMFWARDIRYGAGERNFFRVCLKYLEKYYLGHLNKNIHLIPEYGRWDDLFHLNKDLFMPLIKEGLDNGNSLLAKWLPRKGDLANSIRKYLKLSPKEYRKLLVSLSNTVEQLMCSKEFDKINYEHVPSVAMNKYRKSFYKNDSSRYSQFIHDVETGVSAIKSGAIYPYQLYDAFIKSKTEDLTRAIEAQWNSLPNLMEGTSEKILPMVDTSGSMNFYGALPARVAWSLGIYISERNESIFKNAILTFDSDPKMIYLNGTTSEKIRTMKYIEWGGTTNIEAAFNLILNVSKNNNLSENEMPTTLLILSDMQFNPYKSNYDSTSLEMIKDLYDKSGYKMPRIIYWNLRSKENNVSASVFDKNVGLVSGFSPNILKSILIGNDIETDNSNTPYEIMLKTINDERYDPIKC
jgi:hypothetical protein